MRLQTVLRVVCCLAPLAVWPGSSSAWHGCAGAFDPTTFCTSVAIMGITSELRFPKQTTESWTARDLRVLV